MAFKDFRGEAKPLDEYDIPQLAYRIGVSEDHLQAFLNVESRSRGFDRMGRPVMLFEPHVFYRNLEGAERDEAVRAGLAYPRWGQEPYPRDSYPRMHRAVEINETAALKSASWGLTQILGENFSTVGYATVQEMVASFMRDEEEHVEAMVKFILAAGIADDLRAERWETVARIYNGPGYKKNGYHTKMAREFAKLRDQPDTDWEPDAPEPKELAMPDSEVIRTVQRRLRDLGYNEVGKVDGQWGSKTRAAQLAFRMDHGLPIVADIDNDLLSALMVAEKRPVGSERAATTADDERRAGSRQVATADRTQGAGGLLTVSGVLAALSQFNPVDAAGELSDAWEVVGPAVETLEGVSPWLAIALGAYIIYQQVMNKRARVEDVREGRHVGRS